MVGGVGAGPSSFDPQPDESPNRVSASAAPAILAIALVDINRECSPVPGEDGGIIQIGKPKAKRSNCSDPTCGDRFRVLARAVIVEKRPISDYCFSRLAFCRMAR